MYVAIALSRDFGVIVWNRLVQLQFHSKGKSETLHCKHALVSSPDPDSQQLRVDYITATWKVGLGNKNDALVPSVPQCLCPKIVRQSKFRTNLAPFSDIE